MALTITNARGAKIDIRKEACTLHGVEVPQAFAATLNTPEGNISGCVAFVLERGEMYFLTPMEKPNVEVTPMNPKEWKRIPEA